MSRFKNSHLIPRFQARFLEHKLTSQNRGSGYKETINERVSDQTPVLTPMLS